MQKLFDNVVRATRLHTPGAFGGYSFKVTAQNQKFPDVLLGGFAGKIVCTNSTGSIQNPLSFYVKMAAVRNMQAGSGNYVPVSSIFLTVAGAQSVTRLSASIGGSQDSDYVNVIIGGNNSTGINSGTGLSVYYLIVN